MKPSPLLQGLLPLPSHISHFSQVVGSSHWARRRSSWASAWAQRPQPLAEGTGGGWGPSGLRSGGPGWPRPTSPSPLSPDPTGWTERSFAHLLPSPEPSPEGSYVGQHSQGLEVATTQIPT